MTELRETWTEQLGLGGSATAQKTVGEPRHKLFIFAAIGLVSMALLGPIMSSGTIPLMGEGNSLRQTIYLVLAGTIAYAAWPKTTVAKMFALSIPVALALVWAWTSTLWAINVDISIRRIFLTTLIVWMVFCVVRHLGYRLSSDILRWTLAASILISYLVVYLDPMTGVHLHLKAEMSTALIGNWRGIFDHKNFAGGAAAICILMFLFDAKHIKLWVRVAVIVAAAYFLYQTQSKTSAGMIVLASVCGTVFATVSVRLRAYLVPFIALFGVAAWTWFSAYADVLAEGILNPATFTGRGQIWAVLTAYSNDNPWMGAGFGSFWNIGHASPVFTYATNWVTKVTIGHSGYFDQLAAVGYPGLALMVFAVMVWPVTRLLASSNISAQQGALIATMLIFSMGHNVTESGLFERDAIVSVFLFFGAAFAQVTTEISFLANKKKGAAAGDELMRTMRRRKREAAAG